MHTLLSIDSMEAQLTAPCKMQITNHKVCPLETPPALLLHAFECLLMQQSRVCLKEAKFQQVVKLIATAKLQSSVVLEDTSKLPITQQLLHQRNACNKDFLWLCATKTAASFADF